MFEKLIEAARTCYESGNPIDQCCIEDCPNFDSQPYCLDQILKDCVEALTQSSAELKDKDYLIQQQADEIERLKADVKRQQEKMIDLAKKLPKRGEWVEENRRPRSSQFVCSECHRTAYDPQPTRDKAWRKRCKYAYCPNCGADMRAKMEVQE